MLSISAVIITYNEEAVIERCLRSLEGVADEIVILDSFSDDRTREICMSFTDRVFTHHFTAYGVQKNRAIEKATFPFILSLDADEELSRELKETILAEKRNGFSFDAYSVNRLNNYCGKWIRHGDYYPDRKIRLWNKDKGQWDEAAVHEKVIMKPGATIKHLKGDLLHYSFLTRKSHSDQMHRFSSMAAQMMFDQGKKVSAAKPWLSAAWSFLKGYFFKGGVLDGREGFFIARTNAWYSFQKYQKLINLYRNRR